MAKTKDTPLAGLKIEWHIPDYIISRFATNFVVQTIESEFKVSFFEVKPDLILTEEQRKLVEDRGTIIAECIGSVIITPERLKRLIAILGEHLAKYENAQKTISKSRKKTGN